MSDVLTKNHPIIYPEPPVPRNAICPCGSGAKFKRCCLWKWGAEARERAKEAAMAEAEIARED